MADRQALALLGSSLTLEEAIAAAQQGHRNFAKRQLTWFRREPDVHWFEDFGDQLRAIESAAHLVASNL